MSFPNGYSIHHGERIQGVPMPDYPANKIAKGVDDCLRDEQYAPGAVVITWSGGMPVCACVAPDEEGGVQE